MSFNECVRFANENPVSYLATIDGDQPRVRGMLMWFADQDGFYYHTSKTKNLYRHLSKNPKVEACFYKNDESGVGKMLRIAGIVDFIENEDLKARLLTDRPFLRGLSTDPSVPMLAIFRISHGEAYFWTLADNMKESSVPHVKF